MFENLGWPEIAALLILALMIFGDKLPQVISDGLNMLRNLRRMATNATSDLSRELGTDIQLTDLHPKTFLRKHLLSEEDEALLRRPLEGLHRDLKDVAGGVELGGRGTGAGSPASTAPVPEQPRPTRPSFDVDAT